VLQNGAEANRNPPAVARLKLAILQTWQVPAFSLFAWEWLTA